MTLKFGNLPRRAVGIRKYFYENKFFKLIDKYNTKIKSIELPNRFKGTFVEKWITYWKDVFRDYSDVTKDAVKEIKNSPWKGITLASTSFGFAYLCSTNPDEISFRDKIISYSNDLIFIGSPTRNPIAVRHLKYLQQCYNEEIIRRVSFGLFSVIWIDNYNRDLGIYKALCPYLKPDYSKIYERIIDIGFCNTWWGLERKMLDIDINPEEWNEKVLLLQYS